MFGRKNGEVVVNSWSTGVAAHAFPDFFASRIAAIRSETSTAQPAPRPDSDSTSTPQAAPEPRERD